MKLKHFIPYAIFAIQARKLHKQYNVSASCMEIMLRIEWHRKVDHWSEDRYNRELIALALRFPHDVANYLRVKAKEEQHVSTATEASQTGQSEEA